ncbi:MAG: hypothetical protein ACTHOM_08980 [Allomuricauda sp.]
MEVDFSSVNWEGMEPMERFKFHRDCIFPKVDKYFSIKDKELGRDNAFDLAIDYTASLFKVGRDEIGRASSRNLSTKTGMYLPVDVFDKYFKPFERQWKGQNRKEQAQIIADSYITQIEKNIESKKMDGFTNMDIQNHVIGPKIEEIQHQLQELSLPSNIYLDDPDNNVIVKSRFIVLEYLRQKTKTPSLKDEEDFLSLREIAIYCRYRGIKVSKNDNPKEIIELKNILNKRKGTGIAGHISKLPKPSGWLANRGPQIKNDNFRNSLIKVKKVLEANGMVAEAKKVSEDIKNFSLKYSSDN